MRISGLVRQIGLRHLTERRLRSTLTVAGVAAGVALLFSIGTMNAAMVDAVRSTATAFDSGADLQVTAATPGGLREPLVAELAAVPGVAAVAPVLQVRSRLTTGDREQGVFVLGVSPAFAGVVPVDGIEVDGDPLAEGGLVVSDVLARRLGVGIGDAVELVTPSGREPRSITATTSSPLLERVNGGMVAALSLPVAQQLFDRVGRVDLVLVDRVPGSDAAGVEAAVEERVGGTGLVTDPGHVPGASNENVNPFVVLTDSVGLISLLVALVLVFNTMSMTTTERRRELSLARALGATPRQLFGSVLVEALVLGVAGTAVGLAVGSALSRVLLGPVASAYDSVLPVDAPTVASLRAGPLALAAGGGLAIAVLGALLPARRAMRASPIDSLRPVAPYEWAGDGEGPRSVLAAAAGGVLVVGGFVLAAVQTDGVPGAGSSALFVVVMLGGLFLLLPTAVPLATRPLAAGMARWWGAVGRLAGDALRTNPRRTSLTVATLLLPLAMVIALGTAFGSAEAKFAGLARAFVGTPLAVEADTFLGYTASQPLAESAVGLVARVPGVRAALPQQNIFIDLDGAQAVLYVIPLRAAEDQGVGDALRDPDLADDPAAFRDGLRAGGIAVSRLMAQDRNLKLGDELSLPTPAGPVPFTVAAIFDDLAGASTMYLDRDVYVALWGDTGSFRINVVLADGADVATVQTAVETAVAGAGLPAVVTTRDEGVAHLTGGLTRLFSIARSIQLAALLIAGFSLAGTAFTVILQRQWAFGLQRTLGMSRRQLARSLALEALAVGALATAGAVIVGLALGAILCRGVALVVASPLAVVVPWTVIFACVVVGVAIAALATLHPRRVATRTPIITALRTE